MIRIGCAGWSLPVGGEQEASDAVQLARYASVFNATSIEASYHHALPRAAYERWAAAVPRDFRFAVVAPRDLATDLPCGAAAWEPFLEAAGGLGAKLGTLVLRLPAALSCEAASSARGLEALRGAFDGGIVVEPGHPGWFTHAADVMLAELRMARAALDPAPVTLGHEPAGWPGTVYYRLHGASGLQALYDSRFLGAVAGQLGRHVADGAYTWCLFDDASRPGAIPNALQVLRLFEADQPKSRAA